VGKLTSPVLRGAGRSDSVSLPCSLFSLMKTEIRSPHYSVLSRRLAKLNIVRPSYRKHYRERKDIYAIAIDSTGLKCFGRDEWRDSKNTLKDKRNWRKLHIAVDNENLIQTCSLTDRMTQDSQEVEKLIQPIDRSVRQITADSAYDTNRVYNELSKQFPNADIVIPPSKDAIYNKKHNHFFRNRNLLERQFRGKMNWQKLREYGQRNRSESVMLKYKTTFGEYLHSREIQRQKQEIMIGCSVLNRITRIGACKSYRAA